MAYISREDKATGYRREKDKLRDYKCDFMEDARLFKAMFVAANGLWLGVAGEPREGVRVQASEEPFTWKMDYHAGEYRCASNRSPSESDILK
jgi:hypothetical protein